MPEEKPKKAIKLQIEVDPETAPGRYSNATMVHMTENEFVFDFIFIQPQTPKAKVIGRMILSPKNAKRFQRVLAQNVRKYEERFGELTVSAPDKKDLDFMN